MVTWVPEVAHWIGLLPIVWVSFLRPPRFYWLLAFAFAVSFIADTLAHRFDPWTVSIVYPVSQAGIAGVALLGPDKEAGLLIVALVWAGLVTVLMQGTTHPDVLLSSVAFGSVAALSLQLPPSQIRAALLVYFGLGLMAWWTFAAWPSYATWVVYQLTRVVGIGWFCYAVWRPATRVLKADFQGAP